MPGKALYVLAGYDDETEKRLSEIHSPEVIQKATQLVLKELPIPKGSVTVLHLYEFWPARHILSVRLGESC